MRLSIGIAGVGCVAWLAGLTATAPTAPGAASGAQVANAAAATSRIVTAAQDVLKTLDDAGRAKAQFRFDDSEQKTRWSNFPSGIFRRTGLRLGDLSTAQRQAVMTLLETAFSPSGYQKVTGIMRADDVFRDTAARNGPPGGRGGRPGPGGPPPGAGPGPGMAGGGAPGGRMPAAFGSDEYYLAFLGTPSTTEPWMLQFGGHHLAVNLTLAGRAATLAPTLTGAQPAVFTIEGRTVRPLGVENDHAFALMASLNPEQRSKATLGFKVPDLVLGPGKDGQTIQPEGLLATALTPAQQGILMDIVREWTGIATDALAAPRLEEIRGKLAQTYFAWSGPTTAGSAAYFRIQGPTVHIEYAPQGDVDHIHTIYRDPTNDYGATLARR